MKNIDKASGRTRPPTAIRGGFLLLAAGAVLDLGFHAFAAVVGAGVSHSGALASAIHALVLAGMVVTFGGLLQVAFRPQGAVRRKEKR